MAKGCDMEDNEQIQRQIDEVNGKLDLILGELAQQRRHRQEMQDLQDDLMRVARDMYHVTVRELEDIHDEVSTGDIAYLLKKLLRNVNNITAAFEQMESVRGFLEDFAPVSRQLSLDLMKKLHEVEQKGYFDFVRELLAVADTVVTTYDADEVRRLGENIVTILDTVKNLTQPEMMRGINNALNVYSSLDIVVAEDKSLLKLLREINTPEARRGLAFMIEFLKKLSPGIADTSTLIQHDHTPKQQEH
jgi:uncharacterized protein YjgD (DUF1641 family)